MPHPAPSHRVRQRPIAANQSIVNHCGARLFTPDVFRATVPGMRELIRSNDPVLLSFVRHLLDEDGIGYLLLDEHMSVLEGSIGVLPRRIMVSEEEITRAREVLGNASLTIPD